MAVVAFEFAAAAAVVVVVAVAVAVVEIGSVSSIDASLLPPYTFPTIVCPLDLLDTINRVRVSELYDNV